MNLNSMRKAKEDALKLLMTLSRIEGFVISQTTVVVSAMHHNKLRMTLLQIDNQVSK